MGGRTFLGSQYGEGPVITLPQFCKAAAARHYGTVWASVNGCYRKSRRVIFSEESQWQDWSFQTQTHKPPAAAAAAAANLPFPHEPSIKSPTGTVDIGAIVTG